MNFIQSIKDALANPKNTRGLGGKIIVDRSALIGLLQITETLDDAARNNHYKAQSRTNEPAAAKQETMHCPKCQCTSHRLVASDGWYCNQCDAGPHILHRNNKLKEKSL
tara:strand:- start:584 stop:910 length:327 start_codon:yes stop_codon:yes gene_type:complete